MLFRRLHHLLGDAEALTIIQMESHLCMYMRHYLGSLNMVNFRCFNLEGHPQRQCLLSSSLCSLPAL